MVTANCRQITLPGTTIIISRGVGKKRGGNNSVYSTLYKIDNALQSIPIKIKMNSVDWIFGYDIEREVISKMIRIPDKGSFIPIPYMVARCTRTGTDCRQCYTCSTAFENGYLRFDQIFTYIVP